MNRNEQVIYSDSHIDYRANMNNPDVFTISNLLFEGSQDPGHNAIECPEFQPLTYRDLQLQVHSVVKTLNAMGFHRNDRIAVIFPSGPETAVCTVAIMAGFTCIPFNPHYREQVSDY